MSIIHGRGTGRFDDDEFMPVEGAPYSEGLHPVGSYTYERHLERAYGLTPEKYGVMVERQRGRCAICRCEAELHVDHDHKTGKVRALLCRRCNLTLGYLQDDPELAEGMARYLELHG